MKTITIPEVLNKSKLENVASVTLFDCNCHLYIEVVDLLMRAVKCDEITAIRYAEMAQQFGQIDVYTGSRDDCESVASILGSTGLNVAVTD